MADCGDGGSNMPHILVTNDDGYDAAGILALAEAMRAFGTTTIVAPATNHSGASSSLSLHRELTLRRPREDLYIVDGTPADCVHLVLASRLLPARPDVVVSGINAGSNLADDTIYSGTVAAALEGYSFGIPAFAFSMAIRHNTTDPAEHLETGVAVATKLVQRHLVDAPLAPSPFLLNVNIPDIAPAQLQGIRATRLGWRHPAGACTLVAEDARGEVYRIGNAGTPKDADDDTDFAAVRAGYASVTPLAINLTARAQISPLQQWLSEK